MEDLLFRNWQQLYEIKFDQMTWANIITMGLTYPTWIISYVLMMRQAKKDGMYASPLVAAAVMFAYEFCFIFIWPIHKISPEFGYALYFELLWLGMDTVLLVQCAMYAKKSLPRSLLARRPWFAVGGSVVLATLGMMAFVDWTGATDGVSAAVLAVALIAAQFPLFVWERQDHANTFNGGRGGDGISFSAIVWRAVGDLFTGLAVIQLYLFVGAGPRPVLLNPNSGAVLQGARPVCADGVAEATGLYQVASNQETFYFAEDCAHFALAPVSAANSFTLFLVVLMLVCDLLVISYLVWQRARIKRGIQAPQL